MTKLTPRQRMSLERDAAQVRSDNSIIMLRDGYTSSINAGRDSFVRRESDKIVRETEKNFLDAIPEVDRADRRMR